MQESTYASHGLLSIVIPAPPFLIQQINERAKKLGTTKQAMYRQVLSDFLRRHSDRLPTCHATYKKLDAPKIRIWLEPTIAEPLKALAARSHVTLRAMAYTALLIKLGHVRHGHATMLTEP